MKVSGSMVGVGLFFGLAIVGPWLAPYDPAAIDLRHQFEGPSTTHWLGTADNGVDLLSALLAGARIAGIVSFAVVMSTASLGTAIGTLAGYLGGRVDHALSALMDLVQSFPGILLHIAILALVAQPGLEHLILALCIPGWVLYARLARAEALVLARVEFVQAAEALGAPRRTIILRHLLPNLAGPIIVQAATATGGVILAEATLSCLGRGPGDAPSWGALLDQGSGVLLRFPHVSMAAGGAIALTVLSFHRLGDTLRDRLARESG